MGREKLFFALSLYSSIQLLCELLFYRSHGPAALDGDDAMRSEWETRPTQSNYISSSFFILDFPSSHFTQLVSSSCSLQSFVRKKTLMLLMILTSLMLWWWCWWLWLTRMFVYYSDYYVPRCRMEIILRWTEIIVCAFVWERNLGKKREKEDKWRMMNKFSIFFCCGNENVIDNSVWK